MTTAIIPVKASRMKSRLAKSLSGRQRRELCRLMLADVLSALGGAGLESYMVVSSDRDMLDFAERLGARVVLERGDSGVNSAVLRGVSAAGGNGDFVVLPSDLPFVASSEVKHLLSLKSAGLDVVIAPSSSFNGTNALLFTAPIPFALSYDSDSFWNHLRRAARRGLSVGVCSEEGLMSDVDTPADFQKLARSHRGRLSVTFARRGMH